MIRLVWLAPLLFAVACDSCESPPPPTASPRVEAEDPAADPSPRPAPAPDFDFEGPPSAATIEVVSESTERRLDISFGPASPFGAGVIGARIGALALDQPDSPRWPRGCDCPCDLEGGCPECEAPMPQHATVGPDAPFTFEWNGELRRFQFDEGRGVCFETLPASAGRYVLSVCADDGSCATTEVSLPVDAPIVIDLDDVTPAPSCPLDEDVRVRAAATAIDHMTRARVPGALHSECPSAAVCIPEDEVAARVDPNEAACVIYVVPIRDTLDVVVQTGRNRFIHHLVADATRTKGLTYPRRR